jgi:two-component system, cell cycle sensor histidine kinase and response regulator CckA
MPAQTLLLVDDEPSLLNFAGIILGNAGFSVLKAGGGREALEVFESAADAIELLVTDIRMPGMDGLALGRTLRRKNPSLKIIYVSGYPATDELAEELERGTAGFLAKPFTPNSLAEEAFKAFPRE